MYYTPTTTTYLRVQSGSQLSPTANITRKRSRVKVYPNNEVYLQDGDEFEFELFNPTQDVYMAKIQIDGKFISKTGIVIKQGERVFLERYLDQPKKFKFKTYQVESGNEQVVHAIANNGRIEIFFHKENTDRYPFPNFTTTVSNGSVSKSPYTNTIAYFNMNNLTTPSSTLTSNVTSINLPNSFPILSCNSMETGKIQVGDKSDQKFSTNDTVFDAFSSVIVTYKMLPLSRLSKSEIKTHCSCGKKIKSKWKFCIECGTKL